MSERPDHPADLRVLHVCSITSRGGTGYMASRICRLLHQRGHLVIVGARAGGKVEERAREQGIELLAGLRLRPGFHPFDLWRDVAILRRCIRERGVQIVNAWHSIEYWTCALAVQGTPARLARVRGLVTPQQAHFFNRVIHGRTAAVFATCRRIEANYREAGFSMDNVFSLNDGVDVELFKPGGDRMVLRRELGLDRDAPLIANIGRLQGVKGQDVFLRAVSRLPARVHAVIAGDGPARSEIETLRGSLGLEKRVHLLGVRADIPAVLAASDIYALCSIGSEGSSRATLEAMAAGLPCVTTGVGMLPDIVKPGATGVLVEPGDADQLAARLCELLQDAQQRQRLGAAARAWVAEHHSEAAMVGRVEEVYRAVLSGAS